MNPWVLFGTIGGLATLGILLTSKAKASQTPSTMARVPVWDPVSENRLAGLHPDVAAAATQFLAEAKRRGISLRITSGFRSFAEQAALYAQGRTKPGNIVTHAQPGESYHNFGLAIDVVELSPDRKTAYWQNPKWNQIGALGKKYGFVWGGYWTSFKDKPHFQMNLGKNLAQLRAAYPDGRVPWT